MQDFGRGGVWQSKVNGLLAFVCVGCVALGAWLVVWQTAFGENPIANTMAAELTAQYQNY